MGSVIIQVLQRSTIVAGMAAIISRNEQKSSAVAGKGTEKKCESDARVKDKQFKLQKQIYFLIN